MRSIKNLFLTLAVLAGSMTDAMAQEVAPDSSAPDSVVVSVDDKAFQPLIPYTPKPHNPSDTTGFFHRGIVGKVVKYFDNSNKPKKDKKFDLTLIGGPSYSKATSVQLALVGAGLYYSRRDGGITPESDLTLKLQGSVTGFYRVGISGNHFGPADRYRIVYDANFIHFPLYFWGLGFDAAFNDANKSKYTKLQADFTTEFQWRLPGRVYVGPGLYFRYGKATKMERPDLWAGQDFRMFSYGMGFSVSWDTRDNVNSATRGWNLRLDQRFYPRFAGNSYCFSMTELRAAHYRVLWRGAVLAMQAHAAFTYGNTPWTELPTLDFSGGIRGYYEERYRARNEADAVVELRQRVYRRMGLVAWIGAGSVFNKLREVNRHTILPSFGVGYRWELKRHTNIRIDVGIGRHSKEVSLGMHETF